jgi:hypothetical protein
MNQFDNVVNERGPRTRRFLGHDWLVTWRSLQCQFGRHKEQMFCIGRIDQTRLIHKECQRCGRTTMPTRKEIEEFDAQFPPPVS